MTTRGFREPEMREVGALIAEVLHHIADEETIAAVRAAGGRADRALPALRLEARTRGRALRIARMALHIVIDARRIRDFGIGTYIRSLVHALGAIDPANRYTLVSGRGRRAHAGRPAGEFPHRDLRAQRPRMPWTTCCFPCSCSGLSPDLVHIPLNRVPLLMIRPYVVTIHDMANLFFESGLRRLRMQLRRYRFRRGLVRASRVIAVSDATKRDVENLHGRAAQPHPARL